MNNSSVLRPSYTDDVEINNLRLDLYEVDERSRSECAVRYIEYRARLVLPGTRNQEGTREIFRTTDVEGVMSQAVWTELKPFHDLLLATRTNERTVLQIEPTNAVLEKPRAWVSSTERGLFSFAILSIRIVRLGRVRIPGYRWRVLDRRTQQQNYSHSRQSETPVMQIH